MLFVFAFTSKFGCKIRIRQSDAKHVYVTAIYYNSLKDSNVTVHPYYDCSTSGLGVMRIPYNCVANTCDKLHVDLSSACVRCGMCMVVAEEVCLRINLILYIYSMIYLY